ncbi:MAG: hypothetical protein OXP73_06205 [Chloroflexota bacterium]|nr:hypothetical protein [Chloroflexota bacterium]
MDVLVEIPPSVYLGLLLATFVSFTFHAVVGRRQNSGFFYLPFGVAGFTGGALAAGAIGATYMALGGLPILGAFVGCVVGLLIAHLVLT